MRNVCLVVLVMLLAEGAPSVRAADEAGYNYVENTDKTVPVEGKIPPMTKWYWCGFKSFKKLTFKVSSNSPVSTYTVDKKKLKEEVKKVACTNKRDCAVSQRGELLDYDRCIVIKHEGKADNISAVFEVKTSQKNDSDVMWIIAGVIAGGLAVLTCTICLLNKLCKCCRRRKKNKYETHV